jgi:predicted Rossmann fold nucleotide-binding protein DprA/Smf involved in DNA uptake
MCGFTVDLLDFDKLSESQKRTLLRNLEKKKKALEAQLEQLNESLKGTNRALRQVERNLKR